MKLAKSLQDKTLYVDDERHIGNSIIVTLKPGRCFDTEEHVRGFDSTEEVKAAIKSASVCRRKECQ